MIVPINLPKRCAPPKTPQQPLCIRVETRNIKSRSKRLNAVQPPRFAVVGRVCCDQIRHCQRERKVSTLCVATLPVKRILKSADYLRRRSCGLEILENGTSSSRAHEHSTTARPYSETRVESAGLITWVPFGLEDTFSTALIEMSRDSKPNTHETTIPLNRDPTFNSLISPRRDSFFPEQRRGSQ